MPDAEEQPETPAPEAGTPAPDAPPAGESDAPRTYTAAEFRAVQSEARNLRARLREIETQHANATAAQEAARGEAETLRAQAASLLDEVRGHRLQSAIAAAVTTDADLAGLDVELATRLVEGVEWGDDGRPKAIAAALRKLTRQYPQLITPPRVPTQPPAGQTRAPAADDATINREKRRLSPVL